MSAYFPSETAWDRLNSRDVTCCQGVREKRRQGDFEPIQQDQSLQSLPRLANQSREKNRQQQINRQTDNTHPWTREFQL